MTSKVLSTVGVAPVTLEQLRGVLDPMFARCATHGGNQAARAEGAAWLAEQIGLITHAEYLDLVCTIPLR